MPLKIKRCEPCRHKDKKKCLHCKKMICINDYSFKGQYLSSMCKNCTNKYNRGESKRVKTGESQVNWTKERVKMLKNYYKSHYECKRLKRKLMKFTSIPTFRQKAKEIGARK
jgi:hypothetical protein